MAELIHFNVPPFYGDEFEYMRQAVENHKICGDGPFTAKCDEWFEKRFGAEKVLLTTSGSAALEMSALLCDLEPGDEVILPSYTFSSTANAFVLAGAKLVFVDVRPDTMNIDETKIEAAITDKTKVICAMHYAGVACEMDTIMDIAKRHNLLVVEDAAQAVTSTYKGKSLGTIGDLGCYSFHETKNFSMGEGGAIVINDPCYIERAEILREKGTNRSKFFRGEIDKYTWVASGSSYLPSELNAAYLYAQMVKAQEIYVDRMRNWNLYYELLTPLMAQGKLDLPVVPDACAHNAHMFYIKTDCLKTRTGLLGFLKKKGVYAVFHYIPLHSSPAGKKYGRFHGEDKYTTKESERLIRLPMYYGLKEEEVRYICKCVEAFYRN